VTRGGLTFLEVVLAVALLGTASAMILGAISFTELNAERDRLRLEAMEVAHRVVLQHLDDPAELERFDGRYSYNRRVYVFELREEILRQDESGVTGLVQRSTRLAQDASAEEQLNSQLYVLTVTVYPEAEGDPGRVGGPALAELRRIYNPVAQFARDPDRMIEWVMGALSNQDDEEGDGGEGDAGP